MLDLFSAIDVASGPVPRTLVPGVIWDEAAEARFAETVRDMRERGLGGKGYPLERAVESARWAVEADLHRKFIRNAVSSASLTFEAESKRSLVARWRENIGEARTNEILALLNDSHAKKVVLEQW